MKGEQIISIGQLSDGVKLIPSRYTEQRISELWMCKTEEIIPDWLAKESGQAEQNTALYFGPTFDGVWGGLYGMVNESNFKFLSNCFKILTNPSPPM